MAANALIKYTVLLPSKNTELRTIQVIASSLSSKKTTTYSLSLTMSKILNQILIN
jgi:hypothetical protein